MKTKRIAAILAVGFLGVFTSGCNHTANANEGMGALLGGVVGGVVGNQFGKGSGKAVATGVGAMIGVVTGANVGKSMDNNKHYPHGHNGTGVPSRPPSGHGHVSNPCDVYSHPGDRAACLRGLEEREAEEKRRREREAYERGRNGGHTHYNPNYYTPSHGYNNVSPFNFVFVWEKNRYRNKCGYHGRKCYKKVRKWRKYRRCGRGMWLRRDFDGNKVCVPKRR